MKRIYHPYNVWEDWINGMWRKLANTEEESTFEERAIEFTGNADLYGSFMLLVIEKWPMACQHNLTEKAMNRRAWVGHAAACLAFSCPEYITRRAWWKLTQEQRDAADAKADEAISAWERLHQKKCLDDPAQGSLFSDLIGTAMRDADEWAEQTLEDAEKELA
jgi:hypothetical protein